MLMVAGARSLGLAARFVSGYVHCPDPGAGTRRKGGGHTHAWAQVLVPQEGWVDFDPTSGGIGSDGLIRVAVTEDPSEALPIHGVYYGAGADYLGMDVEVDVEAWADRSICTSVPEPWARPDVALNTA